MNINQYRSSREARETNRASSADMREVKAGGSRHRVLVIIVMVLFLTVLAVLLRSSFAKAAGGSADNGNSFKYYRELQISYGDSLWSIASENLDRSGHQNVEDYVQEIKSVNGLTSDTIHAGNYLVIPYL